MKTDETKDFTSKGKSFPELSCDYVVLCISQALHVSKTTKAFLEIPAYQTCRFLLQASVFLCLGNNSWVLYQCFEQLCWFVACGGRMHLLNNSGVSIHQKMEQPPHPPEMSEELGQVHRAVRRAKALLQAGE